jgi:oxalate decarboxylase/phosphoglucose isomerase-like protein (cupin superfamily)
MSFLKAHLSMATVKKLFMTVTGVVFSVLMSTSKGEAVPDAPKVTSPPTGEAFDFPEVTSDPNPVRSLQAGGDQLTFLKTTEDTGGQYILMDAIIQPGGGPPPHIHRRSDEWFYFIDPGFTLYMGHETYPEGVIPGINAPKANIHAINANPGTLFYGSRNQIHTFTNTGTMPAKARFVVSPSAEIDKWFQAAGVPITDPSNPPAFDPSKRALAASIAPNYGLNISSNFGEFVDTVHSNFPDEMVKDNRADELIALLSNNARPVPESSSGLGVLAFGAFCAISILKRKHKSVSRVATVAPKIT